MSFCNTLLFGIYPYIALLVFIVASIIRYDRDQYTWKAGSSQLLHSTDLRKNSNMFHIGIIMILMGHFAGLLTPHEVYANFVSAHDKQLSAMMVGGFFGVVCLIGMTGLLKRRLTDPRVRASSSNMDIAILVLLYVQLLLGLLTIVASFSHLDGSVMMSLGLWAQKIVTFQGYEAAQAIAEVNIIYKLHVFLGLTIVLLFPFSRLVHIASVPVKYFWRSYQVVRQK